MTQAKDMTIEELINFNKCHMAHDGCLFGVNHAMEQMTNHLDRLRWRPFPEEKPDKLQTVICEQKCHCGCEAKRTFFEVLHWDSETQSFRNNQWDREGTNDSTWHTFRWRPL